MLVWLNVNELLKIGCLNWWMSWCGQLSVFVWNIDLKLYRFFKVLNVDDNYDDDCFDDYKLMTCWFYGCKYLIMQLLVNNINVGWLLCYCMWSWVVHCRVLTWSSCIHSHTSQLEVCKYADWKSELTIT